MFLFQINAKKYHVHDVEIDLLGIGLFDIDEVKK